MIAEKPLVTFSWTFRFTSGIQIWCSLLLRWDQIGGTWKTIWLPSWRYRRFHMLPWNCAKGIYEFMTQVPAKEVLESYLQVCSIGHVAHYKRVFMVVLRKCLCAPINTINNGFRKQFFRMLYHCLAKNVRRLINGVVVVCLVWFLSKFAHVSRSWLLVRLRV